MYMFIEVKYWFLGKMLNDYNVCLLFDLVVVVRL